MIGVTVSAIIVAGVLLRIWPFSNPQNWSRPKKRRYIERLKKRRDRIGARMAEVYGAGQRCPNCLRWDWESERPHRWTCTSQPAIMTCGTCDHRSHWIDGPVMIPIDTPQAKVVIDE